MVEISGELEELDGLEPRARGEVCARHVQSARDRVGRAFQRGEPTADLLRLLASEHDRLLQGLFRCVAGAAGETVSLVALGGYGRGELFPHSDLDLLVLHEEVSEGLLDRVVETVIYPLWDARVSVGHAVRTIDETLDLAAEDLTVRTALLDARLLAGDEGPFHALEAGGLRRFFGPQRVGEFVAALREERARRHRRFGETEYLLEPNIKQSKGGLRDLNTALWAARARFGVTGLEQVAEVGAGTARQVARLTEARDLMQRLRMAMHLESGRAQDHLSFALQETLAPRLFPEVQLPGVKRRSPAVTPAVERLMHAFYRHARAVVLESEGVLERCGGAGVERGGGQPASEREGEHFRLSSRRISSVEPGRFWDEPAEILRAFAVALEHGATLDRTLQDAIAEAVADEAGLQLPADERAAELWMEILCDPERPGEGTVLEEMHHLGVLGALFPEFEPCTGRIQHDLYHVYTVDLHSLYVVAQLKAWRRGEQAERFPTPVALIARLERLEGLLLAALLHDVGKPLGRGHAAKGARLAAGVAARLGLDRERQEEVDFLVGKHLLMAHISQRRDLADPAVIAAFVDQVGTVDRLRQLYLLTAADTAMTAPGNLTDWKARLLDELYMKAYLHLTHEREHAEADRIQRLEQRRDALELALRRSHGPVAAAMTGRVPDELLLAGETGDLVHHLGVALELERIPDAVLRVATRPASGGTELTVCCSDSPGRLATITGVMLVHRIEVLAAQVFTLESPTGSLVLDVFTVKAEGNGTIWSTFTDDLERALRGELAVDEAVRRRTRPSTLHRVLPRVAIEVNVDNDASGRLTVVEVQAPDRLGVLHAITRTLSEEALVIHLSKVASEAGRVIDIFYVSDAGGGGKVEGEDRIARLRRRVTAAIAELEPPRAGGADRNVDGEAEEG